MMQIDNEELLRGSTVFILESHERGNSFCDAHPCPNCNNALIRYGVRQAVFTNDDGSLGVWSFTENSCLPAPSYELAKKNRTFIKDPELSKQILCDLAEK